MEVFLKYAEDSIQSNQTDSISLIRKCIIMLDLENSTNYIEKFLEICIVNKYTNLLSLLMQDNRDIDKHILGLLSKHFNKDVINIFIKNGIDIDTIIKISFNDFTMDEKNILSLTTNKDFFKKDKSYLCVYACHYGFTKLLSKLLMNSQHKELEHALLHAIYNNQIDCIRELLIYQVNLNNYVIHLDTTCIIGNFCKNPTSCIAMYKKRGIYPLTAAVKKNNNTIFNLLLDNKANPEICEFDKSKSILNIAIENRNLNIIRTLVEEYNFSIKNDPVEEKISFNTTFLPMSIKTDNSLVNILLVILLNIVQDKLQKNYIDFKKILDFFLDKGISPKECCPVNNMSVFTALCNIEIYKLLPENIYDELLDIFIDKGADINFGLLSACNTPSYSLQFPPTVKKNNARIVELLIAKKADVDHNSGMMTPLMLSIYKKNYENANILLEYGADPNITDKYGNTALNYSILKINYNHETDFFSKIYADYVIANNFNKVNMVCFNSNVYDMIDILLSYGADINLKDDNELSFKDYIDKGIQVIKNNTTPSLYENELETLEVVLGCLFEPVAYSIYHQFKIRAEEFEEYILPKIPPDYLCPISKYPLLDPVIAADGYSYSRKSITTHMDYSMISPVTKKMMETSKLTQNFVLKSMVHEHVTKLVNDYFEF